MVRLGLQTFLFFVCWKYIPENAIKLEFISRVSLYLIHCNEIVSNEIFQLFLQFKIRNMLHVHK
jgi:hypothetical protein